MALAHHHRTARLTLRPVAASDEAAVVCGIGDIAEDDEGCAGVLGLEGGELGYWLEPRAQGRGYATEAARCVVGAHFAGEGGTLASGYFEDNLRSARVLGKLGFVETGRDRRFCKALGIERPHVIMQLTRESFV